MEYTFTLKYALKPADADIDAVMERLGAQGCTDAIVGVGQPGRIALQFTRSASSAQAALQSAITTWRKPFRWPFWWRSTLIILGKPMWRLGLASRCRLRIQKITQAV